MMSSTRHIASTSPARALLEALALATLTVLSLGLVVLTNAGLPGRLVSQGVLLVSGLAPLWYALRRRPSQGTFFQQALAELISALIIATCLAAVTSGLVYLLASVGWGRFEAIRAASRDAITFLPLTMVAPLYGGFRVALRLYLRWDRLRRQYIVWGLTHAHLTVVLAVAVVAIVAAIYLSGAHSLAQLPGTGPLGRIADWVVFTLFPSVGILGLFALVGLLLFLPPSALFSYLTARHTVRRLQTLTETTTALRQGQLGARSPVEGEDEVAQLQRDLNAMADTLERTLADLQAERDRVSSLLEARRNLVASVSHELRTPAAVIRSHLESTLEHWDAQQTDRLYHDLTVLLRETTRLEALIDDLFTLSRAEVGQLALRREPVDVADLIEEVVAAAAPLAWQGSRIELVSETPARLKPVLADPDRLAQILHNLIHNALRHTPPGGIVAVQALAHPETVEIAVSDTGEGIPPDDLPHIWERFYRGADSAAGAGLGLAIVKELVETMGGSVHVESTVGQGSRFSLRLPLA